MKPKDILRIKQVEQYIDRKIVGKGRYNKTLRGEFVSVIVDTMSFPDYYVEELCIRGLDVETSTHYRRLRRFRIRCECPEFNAKAEQILEGWHELSRGVRNVQQDRKEVRAVESTTNAQDSKNESWRAGYTSFCEAVADVAEPANGGNGNQ